jgi:hypothetical protein
MVSVVHGATIKYFYKGSKLTQNAPIQILFYNKNVKNGDNLPFDCLFTKLLVYLLGRLIKMNVICSASGIGAT